MSDSSHIETVVFNPGDVLFHENEVSFHFYVIQSGEVEVFKQAPGGRPVVLAKVGEGVSIGEFAMLDRRPRSATARAITTVHATLISEEAYSHLIEELPVWATAMMRALVDRIRTSNDLIRRNVETATSLVREEIEKVEYQEGGTYIGETPDLG